MKHNANSSEFQERKKFDYNKAMRLRNPARNQICVVLLKGSELLMSTDIFLSFEDFANFTVYNFDNVSLREILFNQDAVHVLSGQRIWTFFFWITFVAGMVGNGLVVYIIAKTRKMWSVTNMYLLNLAIVDMLYLLSTIPSTANWTNYWPLEEFLCK